MTVTESDAIEVLGAVYPNRDIMHKWMGPPGSCTTCNGRGWYPDEESPLERYCDCPCGDERRKVDGAPSR